jgi:hypothetical protein
MSTVDLAGARWRKSSYSSGTGGGNSTCVEVAFSGPTVAIRDSKNAPGPVLTLPANAWTAFIRL